MAVPTRTTEAARLATDRDVPTLAVSLARAFATDPVQRWMIPVRNRHRRMVRLFEVLLGIELRRGEVYTTADGVGAAIWAPPGRWRFDAELSRPLIEASPAILGSRLERSARLAAVMEGNHPEEPHWYLATLGTHPDWQHRGIGSRLLEPVLQRCDAEGLPAYLESSKEENVPFYRRHGFEVTKSLEVRPDGPTLWGMRREPRASDAR